MYHTTNVLPLSSLTGLQVEDVHGAGRRRHRRHVHQRRQLQHQPPGRGRLKDDKGSVKKSLLLCFIHTVKKKLCVFKRESNVTLKHENDCISKRSLLFQPPFVMDKWILGMDQKQTVDYVINYEVRDRLSKGAPQVAL